MCGGVERKTRRHQEVRAFCAGRYGRQRIFPMFWTVATTGGRPPTSEVSVSYLTLNFSGSSPPLAVGQRAKARGLTKGPVEATSKKRRRGS